MTGWVRAIRHGWVVAGGVPGPDVDEFAEVTEVVAALAWSQGGGDTLLACNTPTARYFTPKPRSGLLLADLTD